MVIGQSKIHHGTSNDLISTNNGSVDDRVHSEDGALGRIDDGSAHQRAECASVRNSESSALHVLNRDLSFFSLFSQVGKTLNSLNFTSSKSWNFIFWQFLRTGTSSPVGVATATEMSTKFLRTISFPSMTELTTGYSWRARVAAFKKKDMNPSLMLYFFKKSSPNS